MIDEGQTTMLAREQAAKNLARASAALIRAATLIAEKFEIADNINGLSRGEFLGRVSFVMSMQRELRRAGEDLMAQQLLRVRLAGEEKPPTTEDLDKIAVATVEQLGVPSGPEPRAPDSQDVQAVPGLTVQMVRALKSANIHTVEDVEKWTDEALLKLPGIAGPSLQKIRASMAAVRQVPPA